MYDLEYVYSINVCVHDSELITETRVSLGLLWIEFGGQGCVNIVMYGTYVTYESVMLLFYNINLYVHYYYNFWSEF